MRRVRYRLIGLVDEVVKIKWLLHGSLVEDFGQFTNLWHVVVLEGL